MGTLDEQSRAIQFYHAAQNGDAETIGNLLAQHPSLVSLRVSGSTPLSKAAFYGHPEVVKLLLGAGAAPDGTDSDGDRAIDLAVLSMVSVTGKPAECAQIIQHLIAAGQRPKQEDLQMALTVAVSHGKLGIADYLASLGVSPDSFAMQQYQQLKNRTANTGPRAGGGSGCLSGATPAVLLLVLACSVYWICR